jgi:aspartate ammonia-lyase
MAAEGGQLQLNAFEPLIAHNILSSMSLLKNAIGTFTERCIDGLEARPDQCAAHIEAGVSTVTALVPLLGYERAASLAKQALAEGRTVRELALRTGMLTPEQLDEVLQPRRLAAV